VAERGAGWIDETLPVAAVDPVDTVLYLDPGAAARLEVSEFVDMERRGQVGQPHLDDGRPG
jgi:hypothetical protein